LQLQLVARAPAERVEDYTESVMDLVKEVNFVRKNYQPSRDRVFRELHKFAMLQLGGTLDPERGQAKYRIRLANENVTGQQPAGWFLEVSEADQGAAWYRNSSSSYAYVSRSLGVGTVCHRDAAWTLEHVRGNTYRLAMGRGLFLTAARSMESDRRNDECSYAMGHKTEDRTNAIFEWNLEHVKGNRYRLQQANRYSHPTGNQPAGGYLTASRRIDSDRLFSGASRVYVVPECELTADDRHILEWCIDPV